MPASYGSEKNTVVHWYLTVALGRETNPSQKAEKRSGYGMFREKNCKDTGYLARWRGGGGEGLRRYGMFLKTGMHCVCLVVQ